MVPQREDIRGARGAVELHAALGELFNRNEIVSVHVLSPPGPVVGAWVTMLTVLGEMVTVG